jgi:hypothetical protein
MERSHDIQSPQSHRSRRRPVGAFGKPGVRAGRHSGAGRVRVLPPLSGRPEWRRTDACRKAGRRAAGFDAGLCGAGKRHRQLPRAVEMSGELLNHHTGERDDFSSNRHPASHFLLEHDLRAYISVQFDDVHCILLRTFLVRNWSDRRQRATCDCDFRNLGNTIPRRSQNILVAFGKRRQVTIFEKSHRS